MSMRIICAQLFIFAAVLFALPQVAQAHAGHAHTMHVHTSQVSTTADHTVPQQVEQTLTAASHVQPDHHNGMPCSDSGCCAQSSCAACFSLVAPMPPLMLPPSFAATIGLSSNPPPSGIAGPSLQRPPRSFA